MCSAALDHQQRVTRRIAEPKHRRDGIAHTRDIGVDVDAELDEARVRHVDVPGGQRDAGIDGRDLFRTGRRREGESGSAFGRVDFDPAITVAERGIGTLFKAERFMECDRTILFASRDADDEIWRTGAAWVVFMAPPYGR